MEPALILVHILLLSFLVYRMKWFNIPDLTPRIMVFIFILKSGAAVLAGYLYQMKYGGGDTHAFFLDGLTLKQRLLDKPTAFFEIMHGIVPSGSETTYYDGFLSWINDDHLYNDNRTVSLVHMLISFISGSIYNVHAIWFAFLSFAGLTGFYRLLTSDNAKGNTLTALAFFAVPSTLFWLSIAGKESLAVFVTGILAGTLWGFVKGKKPLLNLTLLVAALICGIFIKIHTTMLLVPVLMAWGIAERNQKHSPLKIYAYVYLMMLVSAIIIGTVWPQYNLSHMIYIKRMAFEGFAAEFPESFNTYIELPLFEDSWIGLLTATPAALLAALWQPADFTFSNTLVSLMSIENLCYLLLLTAAVVILFRKRKITYTNSLFICLFFSIGILILAGLTTPVAGALIRYKSIATPFLMFIIAMSFTFKKSAETKDKA